MNLAIPVVEEETLSVTALFVVVAAAAEAVSSVVGEV